MRVPTGTIYSIQRESVIEGGSMAFSAAFSGKGSWVDEEKPTTGRPSIKEDLPIKTKLAGLIPFNKFKSGQELFPSSRGEMNAFRSVSLKGLLAFGLPCLFLLYLTIMEMLKVGLDIKKRYSLLPGVDYD